MRLRVLNFENVSFRYESFTEAPLKNLSIRFTSGWCGIIGNFLTGAAYVFATAADLLIGLGANKTNVKEGDTLTYILTAKNFGPNRASNVVVTDTLSSGLTFVSAAVSH